MPEVPVNCEDTNDVLLERGRWLFTQQCIFVSGAPDHTALPDTRLPEIAVIGRSNVGKSTLINALTNRKRLARTSNTPGRTQHINFFQIGEALMLADLPGYGYARASKREIQRWTQLIFDYLLGRPPLRRVYLLIDARHGLKSTDQEVMKNMDDAAVSYQIVLTKCDKVKNDHVAGLIVKIGNQIEKHVAAHPRILQTSSIKGEGIELLRAELALIADIR